MRNVTGNANGMINVLYNVYSTELKFCLKQRLGISVARSVNGLDANSF